MPPFRVQPVDPGSAAQLAPRVVPFPRPDVAVLEPIMHPLWSAVCLDNAVIPDRVQFFRYAQGGTVAGAGTGAVTPATELHTSMETANSLPTPKIALVLGYSIVVPALDSTLTALLTDTQGAAETATVSTLVEDLQRILYGTVFRFEIGGIRTYYEAPTWTLPGNTGVEGVVSSSVNALAAQGPFQVNLTAVQGQGQFLELYKHAILLPSQQTFLAELVAAQATPPTLVAERLVWCVLPAITGREVM